MVRTSRVGRYTVRMAFSILRFRTRIIWIPSSTMLALLYVRVQLVIKYWVRMVSDSILIILGEISITDLSSFLTIKFTLHT